MAVVTSAVLRYHFFAIGHNLENGSSKHVKLSFCMPYAQLLILVIIMDKIFIVLYMGKIDWKMVSFIFSVQKYDWQNHDKGCTDEIRKNSWLLGSWLLYLFINKDSLWTRLSKKSYPCLLLVRYFFNMHGFCIKAWPYNHAMLWSMVMLHDGWTHGRKN